MSLRLVDIFGYLSVLLRAGTLVFQSLLLGGILFRFWIARPSPELDPDHLARVQLSSARMLRLAAIALAIVQALYLYVNSAVLMITADIGIRDVVGANFFIAGSIVLLGAVLVAFLAKMPGSSGAMCLGSLAAVALTASAMTNHAAARIDNRVPLFVLSLLHELATGFWIGGLPFLLLGIFVARDEETKWYVCSRFSRLALVSVVLLVFTGLGMSYSYIGSWRALYGTSYGIMVAAKVAMLGSLLVLGGINYLLLRKYGSGHALPRLRHLVEAEIGIGLTIVLSAASLTSQPPAADMGGQMVDGRHIVQRMAPRWPRLQSPDLASLATIYRLAHPDAKPLPAAYTFDGAPILPGDLADIQWSEYNHHWMGVLVLAMGLLALLARTGKFRWAEYWPLILIGIAIFIFLRADPENWPLGPGGFWASWLRPEPLQHRIAGILCVAFAIFELRVRRRGAQAGRLSLVFPLLCAAGGALLLTHSHSVTNVQEELLAEMNHAPLGILAVLAGWSRWLELRLPEKDRTIPAWVWPVCFILIGAGLLNYREL